MNPTDKEMLDNLKVYISPEIITKYNHKQSQPREWVRFYYYKNKKRHSIPGSQIKYDYEVSSTLNYHKNTFYKMTTMSSSDGYFDYYFKLKDHLPSCVVKKSNRSGKSDKTKIVRQVYKNKPDYKMTPDGKFLVTFD